MSLSSRILATLLPAGIDHDLRTPMALNGTLSNGSTSVAQASIAQDIERQPDYHADSYIERVQNGGSRPLGRVIPTTTSSYERPKSTLSPEPNPRVMLPIAEPEVPRVLTTEDHRSLSRDEYVLLRDDNVMPPDHPKATGAGLHGVISRSLIRPSRDGELSVQDKSSNQACLENQNSETSPLIAKRQDQPYKGHDEPENPNEQWADAISAGQVLTTWQTEVKVLAKYSRSLVITFMLQYSLSLTSVFTLGHLGSVELGASSLGSMTVNITGYAIYQGLATSLDTLCAQAYGSGHKKLVDLQLQRMIWLLWLCTIPIGIVWLSGPQILSLLVPEPHTAQLAGLYVRIVLLGAPGYAAFEAGKRYVQAQGLMSATFFVLLFVAPVNIILHWLFVWRFRWGFVGAPIAVVVTDNLLPLCLFLYVRCVAGMDCWGGFSGQAFKNWGPMIKLALPGLVMVLAEYLAFEVLTLSASWMGMEQLAAQCVLLTVCCVIFQIPFAIGIAASTRVANLIGAALADAAKLAAKVALVVSVFVGLFNVTLISILRKHLPMLLTDDVAVIDLISKVLPVCAAF